jgi:hypothetical protein
LAGWGSVPAPQSHTDEILIVQVYDDSARTFVYAITGRPSNSVRLTTPAQPTDTLRIAHAFLVLQIHVDGVENDFAFEIVVSEATRSCRLHLTYSTHQHSAKVNNNPSTTNNDTSYSARLPLSTLRKDIVS